MRKMIKKVFRRKNRPARHVEVIDLDAWNGKGDAVVTPINRPDSLHPREHTLPAVDPDQADLRLAVTQLVAELSQRGALDAGHAAVIDHWVDSQLPGWLAVVEQESIARARSTERLIAADVENLNREAQELLELRREQLRLDEYYRHWRDVLTGARTGFAPSASPQRAEAVAELEFPELKTYQPKALLDQDNPRQDAPQQDSRRGPHLVGPNESNSDSDDQVA